MSANEDNKHDTVTINAERWKIYIRTAPEHFTARSCEEARAVIRQLAHPTQLPRHLYYELLAPDGSVVEVTPILAVKTEPPPGWGVAKPDESRRVADALATAAAAIVRDWNEAIANGRTPPGIHALADALDRYRGAHATDGGA